MFGHHISKECEKPDALSQGAVSTLAKRAGAGVTSLTNYGHCPFGAHQGAAVRTPLLIATSASSGAAVQTTIHIDPTSNGLRSRLASFPQAPRERKTWASASSPTELGGDPVRDPHTLHFVWSRTCCGFPRAGGTPGE